jgi:trans-aconitate methyltransferase
MFSHEWYDEYFRRAASSAAHSRFCERVYGADLCQHGMMDMAELDFLVSLIEPSSKILEVGCSNGHITEYIHDRTSSSILGIDYSAAAIDQARERTWDKSGTLRFERVDLTQEPIPGEDYDTIILIDSLYFLGEFEDSLPRLLEKLGDAGKLIVTVFQDKTDQDPDDVLLPDHTFLAQALRGLGLTYTAYDFTANVRNHWLMNYQVAEELRQAFIDEGNQFLYEARRAENVGFKESVEEDALVRFMYVIDKN